MWSPEKGLQSPLKTPTKSISAMTLRSSPRKRSLINELSEVRVSGPDASHSSPSSKRSTPSKGSPGNAKKIRLQEGSMNRNNGDVPLEILLKGFSQDQLISIITGMVQVNPRLEESIRSDLSIPDIAPLEEQLSYQKRNIFKSLPATRLVSKTDSPAYARAATHLAAFKKYFEFLTVQCCCSIYVYFFLGLLSTTVKLCTTLNTGTHCSITSQWHGTTFARHRFGTITLTMPFVNIASRSCRIMPAVH